MNPTPAEDKLITAAKDGCIADFSVKCSADPLANDPSQGQNWGSDRTIRAEVIYALAVGANPEWPRHAKGVQLAGAKILGALDFQGARILCTLAFIQCYIGEPVTLVDATARTIALYGCHVRSVSAFRLSTAGSLLLNKGFVANEGV
jgi:hypothetical protein